jgi:hypothetical protein
MVEVSLNVTTACSGFTGCGAYKRDLGGVEQIHHDS